MQQYRSHTIITAVLYALLLFIYLPYDIGSILLLTILSATWTLLLLTAFIETRSLRPPSQNLHSATATIHDIMRMAYPGRMLDANARLAAAATDSIIERHTRTDSDRCIVSLLILLRSSCVLIVRLYYSSLFVKSSLLHVVFMF